MVNAVPKTENGICLSNRESRLLSNNALVDWPLHFAIKAARNIMGTVTRLSVEGAQAKPARVKSVALRMVSGMYSYYKKERAIWILDNCQPVEKAVTTA